MAGARDKVTLVQASGWLSDYHQSKLNVTQFPTIFRWSKLRDTAPSSNANSEVAKLKPFKTEKRTTPETLSRVQDLDSWRDKPANSLESWRNRTVSPSGSALLIDLTNERDDANSTDVGTEVSQNAEQICKYFKKVRTDVRSPKAHCSHKQGFCNRGDKCNFEHDPSTQNGKPPGSPAFNMDRSRVSSDLPTSTPPGFITVNKDFQRLDDYIRPPSQAEYALYNKRFHEQKPCNNYHLKRMCTVTDCQFDHTALRPEVRRVLEYVLKLHPCPKKGDCRAGDCYYGHICQKDGCYGQSKGCRMRANMHAIDPKVVSIVPADEVDKPVPDITSQMGNDANEMANDVTQVTEDDIQTSSAPTWNLQPQDESDYLW